MRVGLDFDGVIADTIPAMRAYARDRHGLELAPSECVMPAGPERLGLDAYRQLVADTHETEYRLTFPLTLGATDGLRALARRHDLFVVTARHSGSLENAVRWLELNGLADCFSDVRSSVGPAKSELVATLELDCFVDDMPMTFQTWSANAAPLLWDADYNRNLKVEQRVRRVTGWAELIKLLRV